MFSLFKGLQVKEVGNNSNERITLSHLRPQLVNLLSNALQVESDPVNTQMLLGTFIDIIALLLITHGDECGNLIIFIFDLIVYSKVR